MHADHVLLFNLGQRVDHVQLKLAADLGPGVRSSNFLNKHIGKNIIKNNFNMFILINYTRHNYPLWDFIF